MNAEQIQFGIEERLRNAGLLSLLSADRSQSHDLGDEIFIELVLNDASKEREVSQLASDFLMEIADQGKPVNLLIHPVWTIEKVDEPEIARSESGGIVAARIVPVWLKSGSGRTRVQIAITYLAEMELKRVSGRIPDLEPIARAYVESLLRWGGESYWNPVQHSYLEITAEHALSLQRMLQKIA